MIDKKLIKDIYPHRGPIFRFFWPFTHVLITNFCVTLGYVYFHILNKTIVIGKENVPRGPNTLLMSNHQTMIDSFLIGLSVYYPESLIRPSLIPWNPAAEENLYRNPIVGWLSDNWKCIPVKRGRKDVSMIFKIGRALKTSPLLLFPEGTRSRDGEIKKGRGGSGLMILESRPKVIPICIDGMHRILPIGSMFPGLFKRIYIYYGKEVDLSEFENVEKNRESAQNVIDKVMTEIRALKSEIVEMQRLEKHPESAGEPKGVDSL